MPRSSATTRLVPATSKPAATSASAVPFPIPDDAPVTSANDRFFVAASARSAEDTRLAFERAANGVERGAPALRALANAYTRLISTRPETLLMQMQGYAVVTATGAQGDDLIGRDVRAAWMRIWETVHLALGADGDRTARFFACGMLGNTLTAIGLPPGAGK